MSKPVVIFTEDAPRPAGHYSQGIAAGGVLYVAGQLPIDPATGAHIQGDIVAETQQVLQNLDAVLIAAGSSRQLVTKVNVFISDISLWGQVNAAYAAFFGEHRPARSVIPVNPLHHGFQIEIDAAALLKTS
jgi:2-iminobutanoate/2-iminopropanoate deaminase